MSCSTALRLNPAIRLISWYFLLFSGCVALKDVRVVVPPAIQNGNNAILFCLFDLEGDSLYSVKWYKGRREFYRYTPKEDPAMKTFPIYGLTVDKTKSNATQLTLPLVTLSMSGHYSCEVSADAPSFHTALMSGEMDIVELPLDKPVIGGVKPRYRTGDTIYGNCSTTLSKPAANLTWFINDRQISKKLQLACNTTRRPGSELEASCRGLVLHVAQHHFASGRLKIRCSASIYSIYTQSTEKSVEEERPRGGSVLQLFPPTPPTDLPPSGRRFDQDIDDRVTHSEPSSGCTRSLAAAMTAIMFLFLATR